MGPNEHTHLLQCYLLMDSAMWVVCMGKKGFGKDSVAVEGVTEMRNSKKINK